MRTLRVIAAVALGIFLCFFVLSKITDRKAEYAKPLGAFDGVPYGDLTNRAANYRLIAYASLIVGIVSFAVAWSLPANKKCPRCASNLKKTSTECTFCGYSFPPFINCSRCGKEFYTGLSKCPFCRYRRRNRE
jgi:hypothetical protein